jgi:hypothetical protein
LSYKAKWISEMKTEISTTKAKQSKDNTQDLTIYPKAEFCHPYHRNHHKPPTRWQTVDPWLSTTFSSKVTKRSNCRDHWQQFHGYTIFFRKASRSDRAFSCFEWFKKKTKKIKVKADYLFLSSFCYAKSS